MQHDDQLDMAAATKHLGSILETLEAVERNLTKLETQLDAVKTPAGVTDQLQSIDLELFEIKQQLNESWRIDDFTAPLDDVTALPSPETFTTSGYQQTSQ